jgi:hypothetical protein
LPRNSSRQNDRLLPAGDYHWNFLAYFSNACYMDLRKSIFKALFFSGFLQKKYGALMFFVMSIPSAVFMALLIKIPEAHAGYFLLIKEERQLQSFRAL